MSTPIGTLRYLRRRLFTAVAATSLVAGLGFASAATSAVPGAAATVPWPFSATVTSGPDAGQTVHLLHLVNLTLEDVGANVVGQATLHVTAASSPYRCLDGASINVFSFEGQLFLHDGLQGPRCAYGTWEVAPASVDRLGSAPLITAAHLDVSPSNTPLGGLVALGYQFGSTAGSVSLIGDGPGPAGPVTSTKVAGWSPARVAADPHAELLVGHEYYVLLLTGSGAAASTVVKAVPATAGHTRYPGVPPGTEVALTPGSPVAKVGTRNLRLSAAPELRDGTLLAPVGLLTYLTGARTRWERSTRQLRMATARGEVIFQLKNPRYTLNGKLVTGSAAPFFVGRVLLVPVLPVARAFDLSLGRGTSRNTIKGAPAPFVITPCESCGGGGGGGNGGSGGSGGGQPVTRTVTTVFGWKAKPLEAGMNLATWCNVPHAPSYLGGFALGSCTVGPQPDNGPGSGVASIGASVFGNAGGEVDQPMELAFTSQAPSGVAATISVKAIVDTADLTYGISGVGGSCAPSQVNSSGMQPGTDTLSTCLSSFQAVVPLGDAGSVTSSVLSYANRLWSSLSGAQQGCLDTPQSGVQGAACALAAANALMSIEGPGPSVSLQQSSFSFDGTTTGGTTSYFTVDPEAQVSDVGLGTEINFMSSWVVFVVTEQYTDSQYAWTFPVAEVGQPLISPWLEQCPTSDPLSCRLVAGASATVTGSVPKGMSVEPEDGDIVLAGSPASGSQGVYQFSLQVAGGNAFDCTIDVGSPLVLQRQGNVSTFTYEKGVGFANERAFTLPFTTSGGVGDVTWNLVGSSPWLGVSYSPPTSTGPGSPPILYASPQVPSSGSTTFQLQAWDDYVSVESQPLTVDIVPEIAIAQLPAATLQQGHAYRVDLSAWRSGGVAPYSFEVDDCQSCGTLPPGLTLDASTGVLSGVAGSAGTYHFVVVVTDGLGATAAGGMSVTVAPAQALTIQPSSLPAGSVNSPYSVQLEASAGTPPYSWEAFGPLPPGLALSATGSISGTPTAPGSYAFTVRVRDAQGRVGQRPLSIEVAPETITTTTTCPPKICSPPPPTP